MRRLSRPLPRRCGRAALADPSRSAWHCREVAGAAGVSAATCRSLLERERRGALGSHGEAYVTPVSDDCVGITILTSRRGRFDRHFDDFPRLSIA